MAILVVPPLVASTIQIFNRGWIRVIGVELTHRIGAQILRTHIPTMHVSRTETLLSPITPSPSRFPFSQLGPRSLFDCLMILSGLLERLVYAEAGRLLSRRKLLERLEVFPD